VRATAGVGLIRSFAYGSADRVVECIERRRLSRVRRVDPLARALRSWPAVAAAVVAASGICTLDPDLAYSLVAAGTALDRRGGVERRRDAFMDMWLCARVLQGLQYRYCEMI